MLDWYISLSDKDQMSTCNVGYVKSDYSRDSKMGMATQVERKKRLMGQLLNTVGVHKSTSKSHHPNQEESKVTLIISYIPTTRTFLVAPMESNHTYLFQMACVDRQSHFHISKQLSINKGNVVLNYMKRFMVGKGSMIYQHFR